MGLSLQRFLAWLDAAFSSCRVYRKRTLDNRGSGFQRGPIERQKRSAASSCLWFQNGSQIQFNFQFPLLSETEAAAVGSSIPCWKLDCYS
jgi:hypothetical protein